MKDTLQKIYEEILQSGLVPVYGQDTMGAEKKSEKSRRDEFKPEIPTLRRHDDQSPMSLDEMNNLLESGNRAESILVDRAAAGDVQSRDQLQRMRELMKVLRTEIADKLKQQKERGDMNAERDSTEKVEGKERLRADLEEARRGSSPFNVRLRYAKYRSQEQRRERETDPTRNDPGRGGRSRGRDGYGR